MEDIKVAQNDGKLTEEIRQHLLQLLLKRQQEIQEEMDLLVKVEALDSGLPHSVSYIYTSVLHDVRVLVYACVCEARTCVTEFMCTR